MWWAVYFDKKNSSGKDTLNLLGWFKTRKTEIHLTRILPEFEIHRTRILPELVYTRPIFNPPVRIDRPSYSHRTLTHCIGLLSTSPTFFFFWDKRAAPLNLAKQMELKLPIVSNYPTLQYILLPRTASNSRVNNAHILCFQIQGSPMQHNGTNCSWISIINWNRTCLHGHTQLQCPLMPNYHCW